MSLKAQQEELKSRQVPNPEQHKRDKEMLMVLQTLGFDAARALAAARRDSK